MDNQLIKSFSLNYWKNSVFKRIQNIHLVGIGGSGMNGIAEVLHNLGFKVSGSDLTKSEATNRLINLGIEVKFSHIAENASYCDAIVVSGAVAMDNIEILVAKKRRIPIIHRAEMLSELMRFKYGIAVAGSHGKTTTTSLIATILAEANQDPTFVVGGKLNKFSSSAKLGAGSFFISEADESDGSFLHFNPLLAVVTNIDNDHLINYGNDIESLKKAFVEFIHRVPFYGLVIVCRDDPGISAVIDQISRPLLTYGFSDEADIRAVDYRQQGYASSFKLILPFDPIPKQVTLNLPGKHNVLNALAAIAVGLELKLDLDLITTTLSHFHGISRRFQIYGELVVEHNDYNKQFLLIDDYGHHPKEIAAVIAAIKAGWTDRRLVVVFQPHRYTRTKQLWSEFIATLAVADHIILLDVYSAGEQALSGISSSIMGEQLIQLYNKPVTVIAKESGGDPVESRLWSILKEIIMDQDILLMQGAGDIGKITSKLLEELRVKVDNLV